MLILKDILKWTVILFVAAILLYFVYPKYSFMGPNNLAFYKCNTITGEIKAWDIQEGKWVTPNRKIVFKIIEITNILNGNEE